jgi:hypothetical protein
VSDPRAPACDGSLDRRQERRPLDCVHGLGPSSNHWWGQLSNAERPQLERGRSKVSVLVITGTLGAGKLVIADEIHEQLCSADFNHAVIDFDYFGSFWPRIDSVSFQNLRDVWRNYAAAGTDHLVLATTLRSGEYFRGIQACIPNSVFSVCLLQATSATVETRIRARHVGSDLEGHLQDSIRFADLVDRAAFEDFAIVNEGRSVPQIASRIIERVGWLGHTPSHPSNSGYEPSCTRRRPNGPRKTTSGVCPVHARS